MKNLNIPKKFQNAAMEDFSPSLQSSLLKGIEILKQGGSVYLQGKCGVGKTHAAVAMLKYLHDNQIFLPGVTEWYPYVTGGVDFIRTAELLLYIKEQCFEENNYSELAMAKVWGKEKGLLVLDDMGAEKVTEWVLPTMYLILDFRYTDMHPTIITGNYSVKDLATKFSDRIASRVSGMCQIIELMGKDRRI